MVQQQTSILQAAANTLIAAFDSPRFEEAILNYILVNNHALQEVETPAFRQLITAANPDAALWIPKNHQTIRDCMLLDYKGNKGIIFKQLALARMLIHITFDGWSTRSGRYALTGVCVHYLDDKGILRDFLISLPEQLGRHFGINYAEVMGNIFAEYDLMGKVGYFVADNAGNNNTCINALAKEFDFNAKEQQLCCAAYILNLVAQTVLFSKDKESF